MVVSLPCSPGAATAPYITNATMTTGAARAAATQICVAGCGARRGRAPGPYSTSASPLVGHVGGRVGGAFPVARRLGLRIESTAGSPRRR